MHWGCRGLGPHFPQPGRGQWDIDRYISCLPWNMGLEELRTVSELLPSSGHSTGNKAWSRKVPGRSLLGRGRRKLLSGSMMSLVRSGTGLQGVGQPLVAEGSRGWLQERQ